MRSSTTTWPRRTRQLVMVEGATHGFAPCQSGVRRHRQAHVRLRRHVVEAAAGFHQPRRRSNQKEPSTVSNRVLTFAIADHPHTAAVRNGSIPIDGVEPEFITVKPQIAAFRRMVRQVEFDVCELAPTTYLIARAYGAPFVALPIFVQRRFHHARSPGAPRCAHPDPEGSRRQEGRRARLFGDDRRVDPGHPDRRIRPRFVEGDVGGRRRRARHAAASCRPTSSARRTAVRSPT